jgi:hypothetical protein
MDHDLIPHKHVLEHLLTGWVLVEETLEETQNEKLQT